MLHSATEPTIVVYLIGMVLAYVGRKGRDELREAGHDAVLARYWASACHTSGWNPCAGKNRAHAPRNIIIFRPC